MKKLCIALGDKLLALLNTESSSELPDFFIILLELFQGLYQPLRYLCLCKGYHAIHL